MDSVFQADPLFAYLKLNVREDFTGGSLIAENFLYDVMIGSSYLKGKEFDITEKQVEQQCQFNMKFFEVNVTLSLEDVEVLNKGPMAAFRLIDSRMTTAYMSIGAYMSVGLYLNGQDAGYTPNFNGLAEMLNDNSTASWDGNTYSTYGGITRGGQVGTALNSVPTNVAGDHRVQHARRNLRERHVRQHRAEPRRHHGPRVLLRQGEVPDAAALQRYPGPDDRLQRDEVQLGDADQVPLRSGQLPLGCYADHRRQGGRQLRQVIMSNGSVTAYPTITTETLWWLNARKPFLNFYVTNSPKFGFGFTGFKPAQGNTKVSGQVLAGVAMTGNPRYHQQLYGISGYGV